jgi:multiple sugar transport system substrate-binding protein
MLRPRTSPVPALILLAILACVPACTSPAPITPPVAPATLAAARGEPVELRVYMRQVAGQSGFQQFMVDAAARRGLNVQITFLDRSYSAADQIARLADNGTPPDLIVTYGSEVQQLADADLVIELGELMSHGAAVDTGAFFAPAQSFGQVSGRSGTFALPVWTDNVEMYVNRALFQQSKVALPGAGSTWDDWITACKRLQDALKGVTCLGLPNAINFDLLYPWVRGYGGDFVTVDGKSMRGAPETIDAIQAYVALWTTHKITPPLQFPNYVDCFVSQKCATIFASFATSRDVERRVNGAFEWGVQVVPAYPKGRFTTGSTAGLAIAKVSKHYAEAWELLAALVAPEAQNELVDRLAVLPVLKSVPAPTSPTAAANLDPFVQGRDYSLTLRQSQWSGNCTGQTGGRGRGALYDALQHIFYDKADIEKELKQADSTIQKCLASGK